jgi:hypothetical protein
MVNFGELALFLELLHLTGQQVRQPFEKLGLGIDFDFFMHFT